MEYLLIDESRYTEADLSGLHNLMAAVIRFEHSESEQSVLRLVDLLTEWLKDNPELKRIFAIWIRAVLLRRSKNELALPKVQDLKELKMSLAQRFDEWAKQHEQRGEQRGELRGEVKILQRLLTLRFGELPVSAIDRLKEANTEQLEAWTGRVLSASTLEDVFQG